MYVCMYVCVCVCMYVCMYVCHVCMYVCTYVRMYVCMHVCMYVCMYVIPWNQPQIWGRCPKWHSLRPAINDSQLDEARDIGQGPSSRDGRQRWQEHVLTQLASTFHMAGVILKSGHVIRKSGTTNKSHHKSGGSRHQETGIVQQMCLGMPRREQEIGGPCERGPSWRYSTLLFLRQNWKREEKHHCPEVGRENFDLGWFEGLEIVNALER